MGTEKMDKCEGLGTTAGDYSYPLGGEIGGGNYGTAINTTPAPTNPVSVAATHTMRVIDELWKVYEESDVDSDKFEILRAITNAVTVLHMVRGNRG